MPCRLILSRRRLVSYRTVPYRAALLSHPPRRIPQRRLSLAAAARRSAVRIDRRSLLPPAGRPSQCARLGADMAKASAEPEAPEAASQPPPQFAHEEPVKSVEDDGKGDKAADKDNETAEAPEEPASEVTEEQWKAMMDVVMAIYNYREEECVPGPRPEKALVGTG